MGFPKGNARNIIEEELSVNSSSARRSQRNSAKEICCYDLCRGRGGAGLSWGLQCLHNKAPLQIYRNLCLIEPMLSRSIIYL
jgi:hypothetical protein